jgi:N-acetylmuramic acid 6-phosphate (MurNAc-6-P) etherase
MNMNIKQLDELKKQTDEKIADRVDNILYNVSGCDYERARFILNKCLDRNKDKFK